MTREDAIYELKNAAWLGTDHSRARTEKAVEMAIQALSQEPCDDAISREAVLNMQYRIDDSATLSTRDVVNVEDIEDLPSVTQKSGKWHRKYDRIVNDLFWECDKCGCGYQHEYNYCPNCGAKMVES